MLDFLYDVSTQVVAGLIAIVALAGWAYMPVGWPFKNRQLRKIIKERRFRMNYNPTKERANKHVTFLPDNRIGEGQNDQEHRWRIRRGKLEILDANGAVYSRFRFDPPSGRLVHTNEPDTRSVRNQYFEAQWEKVKSADRDENSPA